METVKTDVQCSIQWRRSKRSMFNSMLIKILQLLSGFQEVRMGDRDSDSTHADISNQNISVGDELNFFKIMRKSGRVTHHFHHGLYRFANHIYVNGNWLNLTSRTTLHRSLKTT